MANGFRPLPFGQVEQFQPFSARQVGLERQQKNVQAEQTQLQNDLTLVSELRKTAGTDAALEFWKTTPSSALVNIEKFQEEPGKFEIFRVTGPDGQTLGGVKIFQDGREEAIDISGFPQLEKAFAPKERKGVTVGPGQAIKDPVTGEVIAPAEPLKPVKPTKKDFQLFTKGEEFRFVEKGKTVPAGFRPFEKGTKGQAAPSAKDIFNIRKQVLANPIVKDFLLIDSQSKRLDVAVEDVAEQMSGGGDPNFIAVDQALITILNKMLDPTSVVRESEYARTPGDQSLISRLKGGVEKVFFGGAGLTNDERDAILRMARRFANVARKRLGPETESIKRLLEKQNIEPADIISPLLVSPTAPATTTFTEPTGGQPTKVLRFDATTGKFIEEGAQ